MTGLQVVRKLQKLGFVVDHVTGSHYILIGPERQRTVVPVHGARNLRRGTLHAICKQAGVTEEELRRL
ncbi:MAG: type II toxin-antitoxin system HicA family toxin [Firmicutes bacterium]|nr:type II toxin-antitoxin system HicA family toxin [Bacillota bacterium]